MDAPQQQPSTLTTAFVTSIGATFAPALVAWAKTKGVDLSSPDAEQALSGLVAVAVGAGTPWVTAVIDSFVAVVVAFNGGLTSLAGRLATLGQKAPAVTVVNQLPPVTAAAPAAPKQAGFARTAPLAALALGAALLAGCGMFGDAKPVVSGAPATCKSVDPQNKAVTVDAVCAEAFDLINQANVLLIAVDRTVTDRVNNQVWTVDQALPYFRKTAEAGAKLDQAQALFGAGTYTSAKAQADATKTLLLLLQKEIAVQAAK
jgi:hypothetical protein